MILATYIILGGIITGFHTKRVGMKKGDTLTGYLILWAIWPLVAGAELYDFLKWIDSQDEKK